MSSASDVAMDISLDVGAIADGETSVSITYLTTPEGQAPDNYNSGVDVMTIDNLPVTIAEDGTATLALHLEAYEMAQLSFSGGETISDAGGGSETDPVTDPSDADTGSSSPEDSSDPGEDAKDASCFVATAAYGDCLAPEVCALRSWRDAFLVRHPLGRAFIRLYWRIGPILARHVRPSSMPGLIVRALIRIWLHLVGMSQDPCRGRSRR